MEVASLTIGARGSHSISIQLLLLLRFLVGRVVLLLDWLNHIQPLLLLLLLGDNNIGSGKNNR